jgi:hypothetical protein
MVSAAWQVFLGVLLAARLLFMGTAGLTVFLLHHVVR